MLFAPEKVRAARIEAGLSQQVLADRAEVSVDTVRRTEWGVNEPGASVLGRLAGALGVDPGCFYVHPDQPATPTNGRGEPHGPDTAAVGGSAGPASEGA